MKWKLSSPELRRIAELLTESVARGEKRDTGLRDRCLDLLQHETDLRFARAKRLEEKSRKDGAETKRLFGQAKGPKW